MGGFILSKYCGTYARTWYQDPCCYSRQDLYRFYVDYLLQKIMSIYKWKLPREWNADYFKYVLYLDGFISILYTLEYGCVCQRNGFLGYNLFEAPTKILVSNAFIYNQYRRIDYDCVVLKLEPNYMSPMDIVNEYAQLLAELHLAIIANSHNTKVPNIFVVKDSKMSDDMKKMYDKVDAGEPAVFLKKNWEINEKEPFYTLATEVNKNYIIDKLLGNMREVEAQFDAMIGLPSMPFEKKERMNQQEVNIKGSGTQTRAEMWLDSLREGCTKARRMFGIEIDVDWRLNPNGMLLTEPARDTDVTRDV